MIVRGVGSTRKRKLGEYVLFDILSIRGHPKGKILIYLCFGIFHLYFEGHFVTENSNSSFRFSKLAHSVKVRFWRKLTYDLNIFGANQKPFTQGIISKDDFCYFILMIRGNLLSNPNYAIFLFSEVN